MLFAFCLVMADVVAIVACIMSLFLYMKIGTTLYNLFVADVMTTLTLADVIAMMVDGNCNPYMGWCFLPNVADGIATCDSWWNILLWQME